MYKADELQQQTTDMQNKCPRRIRSAVSAAPGSSKADDGAEQGAGPSTQALPVEQSYLELWSPTVADLGPRLHTRPNDYTSVTGDALSNEIR